MSNSPRISLKRIKIDQANSRMFMAVAVASVVTAVSMVSLAFLWDIRGFNNRVIAERKDVLATLEDNVVNAQSLADEYVQLEQSPVDSSAVLDALPPILDYPAISVSIDKLVQEADLTLNSFSGQDNSATAISEEFDPLPVPIPINIEVTGSYENVQRLIENMERVTRPLQITSVEYSGTNREMNASIQFITFYQPATIVDLDSVKKVR